MQIVFVEQANLTIAQFDRLICLRRCCNLCWPWSCSLFPEVSAQNHSLLALICCWWHELHSWSKKIWDTKCGAEQTKNGYQIIHTTLECKNLCFAAFEFGCAANISESSVSNPAIKVMNGSLQVFIPPSSVTGGRSKGRLPCQWMQGRCRNNILKTSRWGLKAAFFKRDWRSRDPP